MLSLKPKCFSNLFVRERLLCLGKTVARGKSFEIVLFSILSVDEIASRSLQNACWLVQSSELSS
jgi:hypothetical protein